MVTRQTETELEEALSLYGDAVYSIARNMCATASEADEVAHQTFVSACQNIASMPADATFRTWLFEIAIKTSLAGRRGRASVAHVPQQDGLPRLLRRKWPDVTESALEPGKLAVPFRAALELMDDGVRAAFVLRDLAELPVSETAAILQTPRWEIRLRVHRARLMLISALGRCFQDLQPNVSGLSA
jgi:RNA polymerase sigma-70 factor (ECF subfamily)